MDLIGRQPELLEVADRLRTRRVVTVVGPAGIGKTTVARAVADQIAPDYELGVHHVDLTRVDTPEAVAEALASQLGFSSFEGLLSSPSEQPALIVLDNCEHVTGAAADAVEALLDACETPTVLATSRSPLGLADESIVLLGPLAVPPAADTAVAPTVVEADAVRLFLERARDAGATLGDDELPAVAELCRQLDGLPLALELAAARTRLLHPSEISARLAESVDVLSRPRFRGDQRHRSLGATIDWSCRLLPDDAASLLCRLGLFAGPFPADLAQAVAADLGLDPVEAVDCLDLLVDSSLVVSEPSADGTRYRLLQTVRTHAVQHLRYSGELDDAWRCLGDHVVAAAADLLVTGGQRWEPATFGRLLSLYDTIASTLRWCIENDDEPTRAFMLCSVLWGVAHQGHVEEIDTLCQATLARWPDPTLEFAADAAATAATVRCLLGDGDGAIDLAQRTLPHVASSRTAPVTLRRAIALAARSSGDFDRALETFGEMASLARERDLTSLALEADVSRAQILADRDLDEARRLAADARAAAEAAGSTVNELWAHTVGASLLMRDDLDAGRAEVLDALDASRRAGYPVGVNVNLRSLGWAGVQSGDYQASAAALTELFDGLVARAGVAELGGALFVTAELLYAVGDDAWRPIAATARSLPLIGLVPTSGSRLQLPDDDDTAPLSRRDAIALARLALHRILDETMEVTAPGPVADSEAAPAPTTPARFVQHDGIVEIDFAGRSVQSRATKGLTDLARLLAAPGQEIAALDLMGGAVEQPSTGETIDATARRDYERRIRELHAEVEEAEAANDIGRVERAQTELDVIVDHLTAAMGMGGRGRSTAGSSAERARSAVTQRIRSTIKRLHDVHPELARHLEVSVTTGTYCSYEPEHPVTWEL